jgi:hypothetical protein
MNENFRSYYVSLLKMEIGGLTTELLMIHTNVSEHDVSQTMANVSNYHFQQEAEN